MRYLKTKNQYKASNFLFEVYGQKSWSYDWWLFSCYYNNTFIFNNTNYSSSTCKHQQKALRLINMPENAIILNYTRSNLTCIESTLNDEIKGITSEIKRILELKKAKGSHKSTNEKRLAKVRQLREDIKQIEFILTCERLVA